MRKESTDTNTMFNQLLESPDKDFKAAIIEMLQQSIRKIPEMYEIIEISQNEIEIIKKKQMEIVALKNNNRN